MLYLLILLAAIILVLGFFLWRTFSDFLSFFLMAYLTRFGYAPNNWIAGISDMVSAIVIGWLVYVLWKDFGKRGLRGLLKVLDH